MRKLLLLLLLLAVFGLTVLAWFMISSRSSTPTPPTVTFTGREPGPAYRAAGFYVTNTCGKAVLLHHVQVKVAVGEGWKTVSEKRAEFSPRVEAGISAQVRYLPELEAGAHRKIVVEWPEEKPWRVTVIYYREQKGLGLVIANARLAWRTRSVSRWHGRLYAYPDQVTSEQVTR
jgi:hypothetical protein